jgi:predicted NBD/HSP70 family sugar kinase
MIEHKTVDNNDDDDKYLYLAAVEGGGSTFRCMVARCPRPSSSSLVVPPPPYDASQQSHHSWIVPEILYRTSIDSSHDDPHRTLEQCASFLRTHRLHTTPHGRYDALAIITFGPVGVDATQTNRYGRILSTSPKVAWRNIDLLSPLRKACTPESFSSFTFSSTYPTRNRSNNSSPKYILPIAIETDVNAPALAEWLYLMSHKDIPHKKLVSNTSTTTTMSPPPPPPPPRQQQSPTKVDVANNNNNDFHTPVKLNNNNNKVTTTASISNNINITSLAYVTVGTGVGVGLVVNGQPVHGLMHPEGGHVSIQPLSETTEDDMFTGYSWGTNCPFGGNFTVEGTTCSIALTERLEVLRHLPQGSLSRHCLSELSDDHSVFRHAANALANLCVTLLLICSTQRIVFGGGLIDHRAHMLLPAIRIRTLELLNGYLDLSIDPTLENIISVSSFGSDAGVTGALVLAYRTALPQAAAHYEEKMKLHEIDSQRRSRQVAFRWGMTYGLFVGSVFTYLGVHALAGGLSYIGVEALATRRRR